MLYWQLTQLGVACEVIAPSLVPTKAGDHVKTDRRDAEKLARCHRAGELTAVWVPNAAQEALRDLVEGHPSLPLEQRMTSGDPGSNLVPDECRRLTCRRSELRQDRLNSDSASAGPPLLQR